MAKRKLYTESAETISVCSPEMESKTCDVCGDHIDDFDMVLMENEYLHEKLQQIASICKISRCGLQQISDCDCCVGKILDGVFGAIELHAITHISFAD